MLQYALWDLDSLWAIYEELKLKYEPMNIIKVIWSLEFHVDLKAVDTIANYSK